MPRATIPYDDLEDKAFKKYPFPLFTDVRIDRPSRSNRVKAPTRVYDRATGNFSPIGWKVTVRMKQFNGIVERYDGYKTTYQYREIVDILFD